jgi:hypothetical protein
MFISSVGSFVSNTPSTRERSSRYVGLPCMLLCIETRFFTFNMLSHFREIGFLNPLIFVVSQKEQLKLLSIFINSRGFSRYLCFVRSKF